MFATWSYESSRVLSLERLREMVRRELPASIYRCKGILNCTDHPGKRVSLQIVGRRSEITELDEWAEQTPYTKIVAIGSPADIVPESLKELFDNCVSDV